MSTELLGKPASTTTLSQNECSPQQFYSPRRVETNIVATRKAKAVVDCRTPYFLKNLLMTVKMAMPPLCKMSGCCSRGHLLMCLELLRCEGVQGMETSHRTLSRTVMIASPILYTTGKSRHVVVIRCLLL